MDWFKCQMHSENFRYNINKALEKKKIKEGTLGIKQ